MNLTVEKMLELPSYKELEIIAGGEGLKRTVTGVTLGEIPNYDLINEGVVILTTAYYFKDNKAELLDLMSNIDRAGAAAICIKLEKYIHELPEDVIKLANSLKLPVFDIPMPLSFEVLASQVQSEIIDEQALRLEFSEKTLRLFTNEIIFGGTIQNVIENLCELIKMNIAYYDSLFHNHVVGSFGSAHKIDINPDELKSMIAEHKNICVELDKKTCGYLILTDIHGEYTLTDFERIAVEHASTVIKLQVQKELSNKQIQRSYLNEFVYDVITDNISSFDELKRRGEFYGCRFENSMLAFIVEIDHFKRMFMTNDDFENEKILTIRENIFNELARYYNTHFKNMIYANFSDYIVVLIEFPTDDVNRFINRLKTTSDILRSRIRDIYGFTITVGIGKFTESAMNLHHSFSQAKRAVILGRKTFGYDSTIYYDQLGVYKLLESIYQTKEARVFCEESIGKVIEYDKKHNTSLFESLKALSNNDWNLKVSSEALFVHYNTMKYRFKRISEILDLELTNGEQKLNVAISLKLMEMAE